MMEDLIESLLPGMIGKTAKFWKYDRSEEFNSPTNFVLDHIQKEIKKKFSFFDNLEVIKMKNFKGKLYPTIGMKYYLMNEINKEEKKIIDNRKERQNSERYCPK